MKAYYKNVIKLKELRELSNPTKADLEKVLEIIKDDPELTLYFYDVLNPGWLEILDKAGEFNELSNKKTERIGNYKAHYLKQCASTKPEEVIRILEKIEVQDNNIKDILIDTILQMPEDIAVKGVKLVKKYLDKRKTNIYYGAGKPAAELMIKLITNYPEEAFEIAESLIDIWVSDEKKYGSEIVASFPRDDYSNLILKYYKIVWEEKPEKAIKLLIKILNRCIETLNKEAKEEGYDVSSIWGYGLELGDLNQIDMLYPEIPTILVKGICESGKVLIEKIPEKVCELLDLLESKNNVIFIRIEMYLLRFVKEGTEKERINKLIGNKQYFKEYNPCWYEHRRLFNDKFDEIEHDIKQEFLDWIEEEKYDKDRREQINKLHKDSKLKPPDFRKMENRAKAEELYLVRERFKTEYEKYKQAAEVKNDSTLAPRKSVSEARLVSPTEGTPLSQEKMANMKCEEVLDYILNFKDFEYKKTAESWGTPKAALAETFKYDVKNRSNEYLDCNKEKLLELGPHFLSRLFYGLCEVDKNKEAENIILLKALDLSSEIVKINGIEEQFRTCYSAILSTLRDIFNFRTKEEILVKQEQITKFWNIIETLTKYPVGDMSRFGDYKQDPVQIGCNLVPGQAMELSVPLSVTCKKYFSKLYNDWLKGKIRECYKIILKEIKVPGVKYVFGMDFAKIYWIDSEWIEENLYNIFDDDNWDEVWRSYVSWGRPSPECFNLLIQNGLYLKAVEKTGQKNQLRFGKEPEEGLVEHLMIGYFQGWINLEDTVLVTFFEKASAELKSKAAQFLTTGFKSLNEKGKQEEKQKVAARMREYWNKRLIAIEKDNESDSNEASTFAEWVCDSVLPRKETLELLEKTLILSCGKVGKLRGAKIFIDGVISLSVGNEMLALKCLKLASADEEIHISWSGIQKPLITFLEKMIKEPEDVRRIAVEVADLYGRYNTDKFQDVWEKLNSTLS